jgi:hypothetical protein
MRMPLHRLDRADVSELSTLMADRHEVMPIDWISERHQYGTLAIEVAYLRALDAESSAWPGQPEL